MERTAQLQREQQNTETLPHILTEVSSSLDLDRALNRTLALLNDAIGAEQGTIMFLNLEDNLLHYRAGYGYLTDRVTSGGRDLKLNIGEGLAGWVVAQREPALIDDLLNDPRWVQAADSSREHRSAIAMPLLVAEDVIGAQAPAEQRERLGPTRMRLSNLWSGPTSISVQSAPQPLP